MRLPILAKLLPLLTASSTTEACTRLRAHWNVPEKHIAGELWDSGARVCAIDLPTGAHPEHSDIVGLPFACVYGHAASIGQDMKQVHYYPPQRWGHGELHFVTEWNVTQLVTGEFPGHILVYAAPYDCKSCFGPDCDLNAP